MSATLLEMFERAGDGHEIAGRNMHVLQLRCREDPRDLLDSGARNHTLAGTFPAPLRACTSLDIHRLGGGCGGVAEVDDKPPNPVRRLYGKYSM